MSDEDVLLDPGDPDFFKIGKLAAKELMRRFKEDPSALPSTFLIKLFLDFEKIMRSGEMKEDVAQEYTSVRTILADLDIEPERKRELLLAERERLQEELVLVDLELEGET
jgi:hypothetical protein